MKPTVPSDHEVVARARRALAAKIKLRWLLLGYALSLLGLCGYLTSLAIHKLEHLNVEYLTGGFLYGAALGLAWTMFGGMAGFFWESF